MNDLIKALQIFVKYGDPHNPTHCGHDMHCGHDVMLVCIDPDNVSEEDKAALEALSFHPDDGEYGGSCFYSFRFGSA